MVGISHIKSFDQLYDVSIAIGQICINGTGMERRELEFKLSSTTKQDMGH